MGALKFENKRLRIRCYLSTTLYTTPLFNYLIVLGKLHLWNCRSNNSLPFFSSYKRLVRRKYETERHIAAKYNNVKMLEAK